MIQVIYLIFIYIGILKVKLLKKEKLNGSEYELLLPRNIKMQYIGKRKLKLNRSNTKNWSNYNKKKYNIKEIWLYKFKIIEHNKINNKYINVPNTNQSDISIPLSYLNKLFIIK